MFVGCCNNCKYLDLVDGISESTCPRCSGTMVSLDVTSDDWNRLSEEEMKTRIETALAKSLPPVVDAEDDAEEKTESIVEDKAVLPDFDEDIDESPDDGDFEFSEPETEEEIPQPAVERSSPVDDIPAIKPDRTVKPASASGAVRKKTVTSAPAEPRVYQADTGATGYGSAVPEASGTIFNIVAVVVAVAFVILCLWRSSSLGGLAALISVIIPFRKTFMNGYDMFEDTHVSIRYIVWGVLIIISLVGVITSA